MWGAKYSVAISEMAYVIVRFETKLQSTVISLINEHSFKLHSGCQNSLGVSHLHSVLSSSSLPLSLVFLLTQSCCYNKVMHAFTNLTMTFQTVICDKSEESFLPLFYNVSINQPPGSFKHLGMDKLSLTGWTLGRVCSSRSGCILAMQLLSSVATLPNLYLKTRPKQLLGSLPLVIALPVSVHLVRLNAIKTYFCVIYSLSPFSSKSNVYDWV
jgi:hypothetical protein